LKYQFGTNSDLIFVDKPSGVPTHSPDVGKFGMVELLGLELGQKLYVTHRLDKSTTGALCFATSAEKAEELRLFFTERKIKKTYQFVTASHSTASTLEIYSHLEKKDKFVESRPGSPESYNAHTQFRRIKRSPFFELWEAKPTTGKMHQIRKHAADLGIPILGDVLYGGKEFPHLCLHALTLEIPGEKSASYPSPAFFERLGLLRDPEVIGYLSEIDRRQRLFDFLSKKSQCFRLIHTAEIRADVFGNQLWVYWYRKSPPQEKDFERWEFLSRYIGKKWCLRWMQDRGADPNLKNIWTSETWENQWQAQENQFQFQFDSDLGQSPGLFLDQRANRQRVFKISGNKKVLNLFSYTCGFSVAAAKGRAQMVTSVDVSQKFLDRGKENFSLNELDPSKHEFFKQDVEVFLKGSIKRGRKFDLIICDPPSFGRTKDGVFKLESAFSDLIKNCWESLSPQGEILFCSNLEKWTLEILESKLRKLLPKAKVCPALTGMDYEPVNQEPLMKAFWLQKP
jgi:23S rRNA (cytosine1962-C5)-methyltransferase